MTKIIKGELEKLGFLKINDDLFAYNTPLGTFFEEFNRSSGIDDDLFTYEVVIHELAIDVKVKNEVVSNWLVRSYKKQFDEYMEIKKQWMKHGSDADIEYDPSNVKFAEWLALKFYNHMIMDQYMKNALWIYWTRGDDEVKLTDKESFDPNDENLIEENEVAEIFRIETNVFDFETPTCMAFKEFNYLLQIDLDVLTKDIDGFKT
nr:C2 calcium/lipid-binding domain, CaLB [Tanacetum cinerariifolium]